MTADEQHTAETFAAELFAFANAVRAAERERMLNTLTRHDWRTANIWRHYYPSATGDYVDLRELRKVLAPNAAAYPR